jgi:hypothetical protein
MDKCNWAFKTLTAKGEVTMKEVEEHAKECPVCKEQQKKVLEPVEFSLELKAGWKRPKCPFCFSDIEKPAQWYWEAKGDEEDEAGNLIKQGTKMPGGYKTENCQTCGACYSLDITCDNEEVMEEVNRIKAGSDDEVDVHIYHNYSYEAHTFNQYLTDHADNLEYTMGLGHLWFARKKEAKKENALT